MMLRLAQHWSNSHSVHQSDSPTIGQLDHTTKATKGAA